MTSLNVPGKIILLGEHAVVYGRPAIAIPVHDVQAKVTISTIKDADANSIYLDAPNVHISDWVHDLSEGQPLREAIQLTLSALNIHEFPAFQLRISSTIPVASGMGSSAAVSVALIRAISIHLGNPLSIEQQSALAFEVEKLHHGTPSGIDNNVVAHEKPIFYSRGEQPQVFIPGERMVIVIADTGIPSQTAQAVEGVRERWVSDEDYYEAIFDQISDLTILAKRAIISGQISVLGPLMNQNQVLLEAIGVSSPEIEKLVQSAQSAGALGAKLSGAGRGGNIIALIDPSHEQTISDALEESGAVSIISTRVTP
jgi:mevalonate kinase